MKTEFFTTTFFSHIKASWRETALIGAAALILLSLTIFSFWLAERGLRDAENADALNRFNAKLTEFVQMLRTVESSQRGYLIAREPAFLKPYKEMSDRLVPLVRELEAIAPTQLHAREQIAALLEPLSAKLAEMSETLEFADSGQIDKAVERLKNGFGLRLTDTIETAVSTIQGELASLVARNQARTRLLQSIKEPIDVIGALLILSFSFLSLWFLLRSNATIRGAQSALAEANADLEDVVQHRTAALRRANEEIQRFAYIVSHDLRSPLVNIMGFTAELETLRKELFDKLEAAGALADSDTLSKDFDEAFGFIKSSITRMDRLIAAILRISREGNRPLNPEPLDPKSLVEGILSGMAHQIREKRITAETGLMPPIQTDRLALEQIFANLIENAIKFTKSGGEGKINVAGYCRGVDLIYTISDNGRGIDPKDHQRIFELFRRAGPQDVPGEGMGLAHVTTLVRRLGGTIAVESEVGRGAAFKLTLPKTLSLPDRKAA